MALKKQRSNKSKGLCKLVFSEDLTIYGIEELKKNLSKEIERFSDFELNLGDVEEVDSSGIQLLLALKRELQQAEKSLRLSTISEPVSSLMGSYGLNENSLESANE